MKEEKNKKLKILVATGIYPPSIGGPATYSKLLKDELPKRGIDVEIVTFDSVRTYPKIIRHMFFFFLVVWRSRGSTIIYAQDPVSVGFPSYIASRILCKRFYLRVPGDYAWEQGMARKKIDVSLDSFWSSDRNKYPAMVSLYMWVESLVGRRADRVIVPSEYLKNLIVSWGIDVKKIHVVYNTFDVPGFENVSNPNKETLDIISIGRLVPWKGFAALIDVINTLSKKIPHIHLYIAGDGPLRAELEKKVQHVHMQNRVHFLGSLPKKDVYAKAANCDLFVLNTAYEGFSHTILEMMSLKIPVITTSVGGNPELIKHEQDGVLVRYNDTEELSRWIEKLLLDKVTANKYTESAHLKLKEFNKDKIISRLCEIF